MGCLEDFLEAMAEVAIAREVAICHDIARVSYPLRCKQIDSFEEFYVLIGDYFSHHINHCQVSDETPLYIEPASRAMEIVEKEYGELGLDINAAYRDARDGTNGGLMIILDRLAENLKAASVERYLLDMFERYVSPAPYKTKVEIIRQLMIEYSRYLPSSIQSDQSENSAKWVCTLLNQPQDVECGHERAEAPRFRH